MTVAISPPAKSPPGVIPESVKLSFYLGGIAFFGAVMWTVFRTREYSPEELAAFDAARPPEHVAEAQDQRPTSKYMSGGIIWAVVGIAGWVAEHEQFDLLLAYHDRSDGGLLAAVAEMMFAGRLGAALRLAGSDADVLAQLFAEELGAVLQVASTQVDKVEQTLEQHDLGWVDVGSVEAVDQLTVYRDDEVVLRLDRVDMQLAWSETSYRMQALRDNPESAREEYERIRDREDPGLNVRLSFDPDDTPQVGAGARPRVAILPQSD